MGIVVGSRRSVQRAALVWFALAGPACSAPPSLPEPAPATRGDQGVVMAAGAWMPSPADVRDFESRLGRYMATPDVHPALQGTRIRQELARYKRQYWGIVTGGRRALLVSFAHDSSPLAASAQWRTTALLLEGDDPPYPVASGIAVQGGGDTYFRLVYDVDSQRFSRLQVNSPL
jgi:hypothetical protein